MHQATQAGVYLQDQIRFQRWLLTLSGLYDWLTTNSGNYHSYISQHQHVRDKKKST
ncbi:TonB-dependent receptor [Acetobacter sp. AC2005]|uniref:TonB-dependent receptor domain-containing protein n=1 Tax=Acetobacter sp. AC2005 TaxID=3134142 RepID=UPI0030CCA4BF